MARQRWRRWGGPTHLAAIHHATVLVWLIALVTTPYGLYREFSAPLVAGFGVGHVIVSIDWIRAALFDRNGIDIVHALTVIACVVALLPVRGSHWATRGAFGGVLILDSVLKSVGGFANHAQIAPLLVLGVLAVAWRGPRQVYRTSAPIVWLVSVVLVLPYLYIGVQRLLSGGVDLFRSDALLHYLAAATRGFASYPPWFEPLALAPALTLGFVVTTLFEASAPLLLVSRVFRMVWLPCMAVFHVMTLFLMNILFWENLVLLGVVFWWGWRPSPRLGSCGRERPERTGAGDLQDAAPRGI